MEDKKEELQVPGDHFALEIDSDSRNEEFARVVTAVFLSRLNPTLEELDDVKTAVSEAVTNAVIHGYGGERGIVRLEGWTEEQEFTVRVRDEGRESGTSNRPWNPCLPPIPRGNAPVWDFPLWKPLWIRYRWSQSQAKEPQSP